MTGQAAGLGWLAGVDLVDAHHHFWQLGRFPYRWLGPDAPPARFGDKAGIARDFLPPDYLRAMQGLPLRASVHVQANCGADDPVDETRWLQGLSDSTGWPSAAIAEVDLTDEDAPELIDGHRQFGILRGIRTPVAWDAAGRWRVASRPDVLDDPRFHRAAALLAAQGLVLECVIVPEQLRAIADFAHAQQGLTLVINHFATLEPDQPGNADTWRAGIAALAERTNVFVKLSGLWTADKGWTASVLKPYFDHLLANLGSDRILWGSNLPVEGVNCPVDCQIAQLGDILAGCDAAAIARIMGDTARQVYSLGSGGTEVPLVS